MGIAKHTTALCHTFPSSAELEGPPEKARSLNLLVFTFHNRGSLEELLSALWVGACQCWSLWGMHLRKEIAAAAPAETE